MIELYHIERVGSDVIYSYYKDEHDLEFNEHLVRADELVAFVNDAGYVTTQTDVDKFTHGNASTYLEDNWDEVTKDYFQLLKHDL